MLALTHENLLDPLHSPLTRFNLNRSVIEQLQNRINIVGLPRPLLAHCRVLVFGYGFCRLWLLTFSIIELNFDVSFLEVRVLFATHSVAIDLSPKCPPQCRKLGANNDFHSLRGISNV